MGHSEKFEFREVSHPTGIGTGKRYERYNRSAKGRARTARQTVSTLRRQFIGWDGEGYSDDNGNHHYFLLANSLGEYITPRDGEHALRTEDIFSFLLRVAGEHKQAIHVVYGASYDFNCWLADYDRNDLWTVTKSDKRFPVVGNYRHQWINGKWFQITRLTDDATIRVFDVVSFFQTSFVKACDSYLGDAFEDRELIIADKARRGEFRPEQLDNIIRYNAAELRNLVKLMTELRIRARNAGLTPDSWHGPASFARKLLKQHNVETGMSRYSGTNSIPDDVAYASRVAYAGGRFEMVKYGDVDAPVWEYDINSAYPAAMKHLPNLNGGTWTRHNGDAGDHPYALYRVSYFSDDATAIQPLFHRTARGNISFPCEVTGWYWSPEIAVLREYLSRYPGTQAVFHETWTYDSDKPSPFEFVEAVYRKRQALKRSGDGAQVALKLALNSMYGVLAQQTGWRADLIGTGKQVEPKYHQLEWAGYITSHCRATMLRAAMQKPHAVIAFQTDALFTTEPLDLPLGTGLGEWDVTEFVNLTYVQSGVYFGETADGKTVTKMRGIPDTTEDEDTRNLGLDKYGRQLMDAKRMREHIRKHWNNSVAPVPGEQFVTAGTALAQDFDKWRKWLPTNKDIRIGKSNKRFSLPGERGIWHPLFAPQFLKDTESAEYRVEWLAKTDDMRELDRLRAESPEEFMEDLERTHHEP